MSGAIMPPKPLGETGDLHCNAADLDLGHGALWKGVGRHDGAGGDGGLARVQPVGQHRQDRW